ncbi:nuclear transport factor 2 family protein [Nonomuraea sp. NPDC049709]|uniref:nuclear transport factor 2 family protein n=1 Tax=Nonomuraea sp. NPDC049709 TaxID=3154736 RepID=UPI003421465E
MSDTTQAPSGPGPARAASQQIPGTTGAQAAAETNRRTVRAAFDAWHDGTGAITDIFAPDMSWRIEGRSAASKEYRNRQQFIDEVLAPFGARFAAGERFRPVRVRSIHADGDTVIVIWDGSGVANDGGRYDNTYAWVMRLRDGQVIDGTAFYDSIAFNHLWRRVTPH